MRLSDNTKFQLKKTGLLGGLFLVLFYVGFYAINLFDFKSFKKTLQTPSVVKEEVVMSENLKMQLGKDGINATEFEAWAKANGLALNSAYDGDADGDLLLNYLEYLHGTDPKKADTDGDGFTDYQEIVNSYDPSSFGSTKMTIFVMIEKIGVEAPMVWSKSENEKESLKDLENGLSLYPKSGNPGQNGNSIISGHSSNYVWAKGDYNYIFKDLNSLEVGDIVNIKTLQKNGKAVVYKYAVSEKFITVPNDERIFEQTADSTLTLSTCWPVGTALKRTIVKADLVK